jgi:hypothetical protein
MKAAIASPAAIEERGVYWAPYKKRGCPVLFAVKRNGERLSPVLLVQPDTNPDDAIDWLWKKLEREDPDPRQLLKLVRDAPAPKPMTAMQFAKTHPLMDAVTWERIQRDDRLRARVLRQLREFDARRS